MKNEYVTHSFEETQKIAEDFAKTLHGGEVLCLYGDLGYGKTTFIQGLAKGLGVERNVNSPTFIIMRTYKIKIQNSKFKNTSKKQKVFYHVDLYRLTHEQEIVDIGLLDMMGKSANIVAIEWPEKMGKLLPEKRIDISFDYLDEDKRKITIHISK